MRQLVISDNTRNHTALLTIAEEVLVDTCFQGLLFLYHFCFVAPTRDDAQCKHLRHPSLEPFEEQHTPTFNMYLLKAVELFISLASSSIEMHLTIYPFLSFPVKFELVVTQEAQLMPGVSQLNPYWSLHKSSHKLSSFDSNPYFVLFT